MVLLMFIIINSAVKYVKICKSELQSSLHHFSVVGWCGRDWLWLFFLKGTKTSIIGLLLYHVMKVAGMNL